MRSDKSLVKHAISLGYTVNVFDTEEWSLMGSTKVNEIMAEIDGVGEAELVFIGNDGGQVGWAYVIDHGGDGSENVSDYTVKPWLDKWFNEFHGFTA